MWKKSCTDEQTTDDYTAMRIPYWIPKATDMLSVYTTILTLPLQQWMHEHASMLRYTALPALNIRHKYIRT